MDKKLIIVCLIASFLIAGYASANWFTDLFQPKQDNIGASTLRVIQGGTGASTFTSGECLVGAGTGAITTTACGGGGEAAWEYDSGAMVTTSTLPVMLMASSSVQGDFRIDGSATTTGSMYIGNDLTVIGSSAFTGNITNTGSITSDGDILPANDNTEHLGSVSKYWGDSYIYDIYVRNLRGPATTNEVRVYDHLIPFFNNAYDLGNNTNPAYWRDAYIIDLYLNDTAYFQGATAGVAALTGDLTISANATTTGHFAITGLDGSGGDLKISADGSLYIGSDADSGAGTGSNWEFGGADFIRPTTTVGFIVSASSTVQGNFNIDGNATSTGHLASLGGNSDEWNTSYSWGDHSVAGYTKWATSSSDYWLTIQDTGDLTEGTNKYYTDTRVADYINASTTMPVGDWNTAFSWGDHSGAGYYAAASFNTDWAGQYNATTTLSGFTNNQSNWNTAYTHSQTTTGNPHSLDYADIGLSANQVIDWTGASAGTIHATNYVDNNTTYTVSATGLELSGTAIVWSAGYEGLKNASSTNWNTFYDTPSNRITDGTNISWSTNTLNIDDAFLVNSAADTTAFGLTMGSATTTDTLYVGNLIAASCDVKATESTGLLYCGTDATGAGGGIENLNAETLGSIGDVSTTTLAYGYHLVHDDTNWVSTSTWPYFGTEWDKLWIATSTKSGNLTIDGNLIITGDNDYSDLIASDIPDISATYSVKAGNASLVTTGTLTTGATGAGFTLDFANSTLSGNITTANIADSYLLNTTDIGTGLTLSYSTSTSKMVIGATNPTTDDILWVGGDGYLTGDLDIAGSLEVTGNATTTGQSFVEGNRVVGWKGIGATFSSSTLATFTGATTTVRLGVALDDETWTELYCYSDLGTSTISILDSGGNVTGYYECAREQSDSNPTKNTLSTNNTFITGEHRKWQIGNIQGSPTQVTFSAKRTINPD